MFVSLPLDLLTSALFRPLKRLRAKTSSTAVHTLYGILLKIYHNFVILDPRPSNPEFLGFFGFSSPSTTTMYSYSNFNIILPVRKINHLVGVKICMPAEALRPLPNTDDLFDVSDPKRLETSRLVRLQYAMKRRHV